MRLAAGDFLTLDLPGDDWSTLEKDRCFVFLRREDLDIGCGNPEWAPFAIFVSLLDRNSVALDSTAEDLMERRVPQGYPDKFDADLDGVPARGSEYSDGVSRIRSYFAACPVGGIVDVSIRSAITESGQLEVPLQSACDFVLGGLHWTYCWTVWRQDDNGIKAEVSTCTTASDAQKLVAEFEGRGHKQLYWVEGPHRRH
jgi:hypothetical protein